MKSIRNRYIFVETKHLLWLILVLTLQLACRSSSKVKSKERVVHVKDFGAKVNDRKDDTKAFQKAIKHLLEKDKSKSVFLMLEKGTYDLSGPIYDGILKKDLKIIGEKGTELKCEDYFAWFKSTDTKVTVIKSIKRGDSHVSINHFGRAKEGDLLFVLSDKPGELSWKYKKGDLHRISKIKGKKIELESKFNFPYNAKAEKLTCLLYRPVTIELENLAFQFPKSNKRRYHMAMRIDGAIVKGKNLSFIDKFSKQSADNFLAFHFCKDVLLENINFEGKAYGALINYSRDFKAKNTTSKNCIHSYAPATWSTNLYFDGIRGTNTAIDAHPSFNVHYNDVDIHTGKGYFNCRALGVKLTNCKFRADHSYKGDKTQIAYLSMAPEFEKYYYEYDVTLENVNWIHPLTSLNGLNIFKARNVTFINCKSHMISTFSFCDNVVVKNSEIGKFKCYDGDFTIGNTTFNGKLQGVAQPDYAITFSYVGNAYVKDCKFINYNTRSSYLIDYIHSADKSNITFENCTIESFKGVINKFGEKQKQYNGVVFKNSTLKNFKQAFPKQMRPCDKRSNKIIDVPEN